MSFKSCQMLLKQFNELKKVDGLSLRGLSRAAGLSPAYLSLVFNSKRLPNLEMLKKIGENLEMDKFALAQLKDAYQIDWLKKNNISALPTPKVRRSKSQASPEIALMEDTDLFKSWLNLAISEFTLCDGFVEDPVRLAKIFSTTSKDVTNAIHWLTVSGFLKRDEQGILKKVHHKIRFPISHRSRATMRSFHRQMMLKAIKHMELKTDVESYSRRLITSYTMAVNPEKVEEAKLMIQKALVEIAEHLTEGPSREVYQLQVQLFPLT